MSDELPSGNAPDQGTPPSRPKMEWLGGAVLILIGLIFLLQNVSSFELRNWWALFILIPAIGSLGTAWRIYQTQGRLNAAARGSVIGGLVLLLVAAIFLFNLNWGRVWPVFLIVIGVGALLNAVFRD